MAEFPYCANATSVRKFMENIQVSAMPRRVGPKYMEGLGFRGSEGRSLVNILKTLGFLSAAGVPTERWQLYRDKTIAPQVMAGALRETYAEVFEAYPDAHRKDDEVLLSFFGTLSQVAQSTLIYMVRTFRTLCGLADLDSEPKTPKILLSPRVADRTTDPPRSDVQGHEVTVHITLQLQLPVTDDPKVYESLFAALRKHLLLL